MEYEQTSEASGKFKTPLWRVKTLGEGPVLLDAVEGDVRITSEQAEKLKAWQLDVNGKRVQQMKLKRSGETVSLTLSAAPYHELATQ
jgi:hypothetical protein